MDIEKYIRYHALLAIFGGFIGGLIIVYPLSLLLYLIPRKIGDFIAQKIGHSGIAFMLLGTLAGSIGMYIFAHAFPSFFYRWVLTYFCFK